MHSCPSTGSATGPCPGYIVDHVKGLACGGEDAPANMQSQTTTDAKQKDKWELKAAGCDAALSLAISRSKTARVGMVV